jgi:hypothetical protein
VTVVGFPSGFPKGLHIVGNKTPQPVKVTTAFLSQELEQLRSDPSPPKSTEEKSKAGQGEKGESLGMRLKEVLQDRAGLGKDTQSQKTRVKKPGSAKVRRTNTLGPVELSKMRDDKNEKLKIPSLPVAPWKEVSPFKSPGEHRRQTFNSFKMMSPDPPKTPVESSTRPAGKGSISRNNREPGSGRDPPHVNFINKNVWSSREDSYYNSAIIASSMMNTSKRKDRFAKGRSITGLTLTGVGASSDQPLKKVPSFTNHSGRNKKFTVISPAPAKLSSNQSLIMMSGNATPAEAQSSPKGSTVGLTGNGQNAHNPWNNILQTNSIPVPPSKRLEQVRLMNHILHTGYHNSHDAASARVEAREKYLHHSSRFPGSQARQYYHPNNPSAETAPTGQQGKQKAQKPPPLQPPVHVPGPKRENIYIGQYDGSDSDSDESVKVGKTAS